jgi:stage IV sporulation protein B
MESGKVCGVILGGIHKGESGKPGELCGVLTERDIGSLTVNSECGVFGVITDKSIISGLSLEIGDRSQITEGEATIISTLKNGKSSEYKIEIYDIDRTSEGSKSFRIRVTDETLKALTGGIVRGMSGSPIIQNGKLIGAVTHVLVADPTEGYGIFIENMLKAADFSELGKAA